MTQQLFDEVIGEVPAPAVDVDRIIRRERRGAVARRIATVSTGGLAAAAAVALALGLGLGPGGQTGPVAAPVTASASGEPVPADGFRLVYGTPEEAEATAKRLAEEFDRAVREVAPDLEWVFMPSAPGEPAQPDGQPFMMRFKAKTGQEDVFDLGFFGRSGVATAGRKGSLAFAVRPWEMGGTGAPVITETRELGGGVDVQDLRGSRTYVHTAVSARLPDGRVLVVYCSNAFVTRPVKQAFQPELPLTVAQLQAIVDDVASKVVA